MRSISRLLRLALSSLSAGALAPALLGAQVGRLEGTITDSVHLAPLAGVAVSATRLGAERETTLVVAADENGRFRFDSLDPGEYGVGFTSPFLDSLEYGGPVRRVAVTAGPASHVALAVPSGQTLRALACPGAALPTGTGALMGVVTNAADDQPLRGARVAAMWTELSFDATMRRVSTAEHSGAALTDSLGQYRLCGVPTDSWLLVQVQHHDRVGAAFQLLIGDATGVLVKHLSLGDDGVRSLSSIADAEAGSARLPSLAGTASLAGVVRNSGGRVVAGAQVRVVSTDPVARTDRNGYFTLAGLPSGTQELEVRELGSTIFRQPVELRSGRTAREEITLRHTVSLDTMRTTASTRSMYERFESNRRHSINGTFFSQEDVERRHPLEVSDLLNTLPWFRVVGQGHGARLMNLRGGCYPNIVVDYKEGQDLNSIPPALIAGIEVYPTTNGAPAEYTNLCGVVRIWVKR